MAPHAPAGGTAYSASCTLAGGARAHRVPSLHVSMSKCVFLDVFEGLLAPFANRDIILRQLAASEQLNYIFDPEASGSLFVVADAYLSTEPQCCGAPSCRNAHVATSSDMSRVYATTTLPLTPPAPAAMRGRPVPVPSVVQVVVASAAGERTGAVVGAAQQREHAAARALGPARSSLRPVVTTEDDEPFAVNEGQTKNPSARKRKAPVKVTVPRDSGEEVEEAPTPSPVPLNSTAATSQSPAKKKKKTLPVVPQEDDFEDLWT